MEGPDPRDDLDRKFDAATKRDRNGHSVPLRVDNLLEGKPPKHGLDFKAFPAEDAEPGVESACEPLTQQLQEEFEGIIRDGEVLYRNSYMMFLGLEPSDWKNWFSSEPAGELDSWEPVLDLMNTLLISRYQTDMESEGLDPALPAELEPYTIEEFEPESSEYWVLCVDVDPATELAELGVLSRPQAMVYFLRQWGYTTSTVADLLDKNQGTVSSHGARAQAKADRLHHASELLSHYQQREQGPDWEVLSERIGSVYQSSAGQRIRVIGLDETPGGGASFYVQHESGSVMQMAQHKIDSYEEVSEDIEFPDIPEVFKERGFEES
jgi:hypothetical protein